MNDELMTKMDEKIVSAVISAGGKGTRIAKLLPDTPKALVEVFGKPIIHDQIEKLYSQGVTKFYFLLGFQSEVIKASIEAHLAKYLDVEFTFLVEDVPLGSGGGLLHFKNKLPKLFFFLYCDIYFDINISAIQEAFHKAKCDLLLVVHPNDHPSDSDLVVVDDDNTVLSIKAHPHSDDTFTGNLVNAAFYVINANVLPDLADYKVDFAQDIIPEILRNKKRVYGYKTVEFLKDMGTPKRLRYVQNTYKNRHQKNTKSPIVYLDRDGTINSIKLGAYITSPDDLILLDDAASAIKQIRAKGYLCVCITNQPVIARGDLTVAELKMIHDRLEYLLGLQGAFLDEIIYCPHHPHSGYDGEVKSLKIDCDCRKPKTGMFKLASEYAEPDLANSWMVGDSLTDILAGNVFGLQTALLIDDNIKTKVPFQSDAIPTKICKNLIEFAEHLPNIDNKH